MTGHETVAKLRELEKRAEPGPWHIHRKSGWIETPTGKRCVTGHGKLIIRDSYSDHVAVVGKASMNEENAALITDLRNSAGLLISVAGAFHEKDAIIIGLLAEFLEKHKPDGHLNDSGPGKDITTRDAAACMRRLQAAAERLE